ncbi:HAD family hydrolase [Pedobacter sp. UBA5917]|jgi:putative hydrolase of the HAD superfamily|uniref:HAD family hydrolase n=1 Tax=Pedobacter sp. UBA5917 TaxID=1947061 RepID=UPI0025E68E22|nr:HAD family hydrolase [Pedobacter sp. UBA5917]
MKHIFFIDLDNTIYFTKPNEEQLMGELYRFLESVDLGISDKDFQLAKQEMLRTPFLKVAKKYGFRKEAMPEVITYLHNREVTKALKPSDDYHYIKSLKGRKFIVTAGFEKQQLSKVKMLGIADDFEEVHVVDVSVSNKKDVFKKLIDQHNLNVDDILIIGDDAESEIKFGLELGISTFLLDSGNLHPKAESTFRGNDLSRLHEAAGQ